MIDIVDLYKLLKINKLEVTFTKVNGDERVMKCTLIAILIPGDYIFSSMTEYDYIGQKNIAVWDLDKEDWRSFKVDSIKSIKIIRANEEPLLIQI